MSGVQVGTVYELRLAPDGKSVSITLRIYRQYQVHKDARFVIEQSGFLGDQYVAILPTRNEGAVFGPGDEANAEAPLDLQEVARSAAGLLTHIDSAATNIDTALTEARATIFSMRALTNLASTFDNFHRVSERSLSIVDNVDALVESNRPSINVSVSNLLFFSEQINHSASAVQGLLATNSPEIDAAIKNVESSAATLKRLLDGVQEGKGLAGKLLENEQFAANVSQTVSNLSITTSNLNRLGLWGVLWQHKDSRTNAPEPTPRPLTTPKNPFD
jgi:phospholipid/cholesterol/gamma-HCH transport system substrate-binding protein